MNRGITLVETVVVIGISTMALIALVNLFLIFNSIYGYQQAFIATAGSAGTTMKALEAAILPGDQVLASYDFSGTTYDSDANTLVLELPAVDSDGVPVSGAKDYVAFYSSGALLYRLTETATGSMRVPGRTQLSSTLLSLSFTYDDSDFTKVTNVVIDLQTQTHYKQQAVQSHLSGQWYLRNWQPLQ